MLSRYVATTGNNDIWGQITPPGGISGEAPTLVGNLITFLFKGFFLISGLSILVYMLWGAFDYINSGGDKDKLNKARDKIVHALIGFVVLFVALSIYGYIAGNMLGLIRRNPATGGWSIEIPRIR